MEALDWLVEASSTETKERRARTATIEDGVVELRVPV